MNEQTTTRSQMDKLVRLRDVERWILTESACIDTPADRDAVVERMRYSIPAVDAVEVVRCVDCKWCNAGFCEYHDDIIPWGVAHTRWRDWFCADGQRREEEHNAVD